MAKRPGIWTLLFNKYLEKSFIFSILTFRFKSVKENNIMIIFIHINYLLVDFIDKEDLY